MKILSVRAADLAKSLGCRLEGDTELVLNGIATIEEAHPDDLTFLSNTRYKKHLPYSKAGAIIISESEESPPSMTRIVSTDPYMTFCEALTLFHPTSEQDIDAGIHTSAQVDETASIGSNPRIASNVVICSGVKIGDNCTIYPGTYIGKNVTTGDNCVLGIGVVIRNDSVIGNSVIIGDKSVIGFDGFGYVPTNTGLKKIPQYGNVILEDDVEIGANCCIDRAAIGSTRIGKGSKLDNLIQVAHGVQIGSHTVIAAQTGISGSTRIGSFVQIGGQVGIGGHLEIADYTMIGAKAGVTKSILTKETVSGYPARQHKQELRIEALINKLPELFKRLAKLESTQKD